MPVKAMPSIEVLERWTHQRIALGYAITREAINQNLYNSVFGHNVRETNEWLGLNLLAGT